MRLGLSVQSLGRRALFETLGHAVVESPQVAISEFLVPRFLPILERDRGLRGREYALAERHAEHRVSASLRARDRFHGVIVGNDGAIVAERLFDLFGEERFEVVPDIDRVLAHDLERRAGETEVVTDEHLRADCHTESEAFVVRLAKTDREPVLFVARVEGHGGEHLIARFGEPVLLANDAETEHLVGLLVDVCDRVPVGDRAPGLRGDGHGNRFNLLAGYFVLGGEDCVGGHGGCLSVSGLGWGGSY